MDFEQRNLELQTIYENITALNPLDDPASFPWNEIGLARIFIAAYSDLVCYCPEMRSWYVYDGDIWRQDIDGLYAMEKLKDFIDLLDTYASAYQWKSDDLKSAYDKLIKNMGKRSFRENILKDACSIAPVSIQEFDTNPYLLAMSGGMTYDLQTMSVRESSYLDKCTMKMAVIFDSKASLPRWDQFIEEITEDAEKAKYLQKTLGYSLLGSSKEECMFILHGQTTRNGKSTLLNTITHLLGDYATVANIGIICTSRSGKSSASADPDRVSLKGKRFVTMSESDQYGQIDGESIKQLTGGEKITARPLYKMPITFAPQFSLWLSCNDLPAITDQSIYNSDRVNVITFDRHFDKSEQDRDLKSLFETPEAMSAIFNWLLEGYRLYCKEGIYPPPECVQTAVSRYREANDTIKQFMDESIDFDPDMNIALQDLYDSYRQWARMVGIKNQKNRKNFTKELDTHLTKRISDGSIVIKFPQNKKWYNGMGIRKVINLT